MTDNNNDRDAMRAAAPFTRAFFRIAFQSRALELSVDGKQ